MNITTASTVELPAATAAVAAAIEPALARYVRDYTMPGNLREAIEYSLLGGGKRLRPALTLLCCEAVGGSRDDAIPAAAAVEMIHVFSLIHDDLPAMDDDDMRRGKPTLHIAKGEAMAILAGDMLMGLAFSVLLEGDLEPALGGRLAAELAQNANAMISGQVYDTLGGFEPGAADRRRLELIHRNKTGALIRAACRMGAISGLGAAVSDEADRTLGLITTYADAIGLMFQIVDDLLDVEQSTEHLGKGAGKDLEAGKLTYPGVLGVEASRAEIERLRRVALDAIMPLGAKARDLRDLCEFMAIRTK